MDAARISALLAPFMERHLSAIQLGQTSTYIDLLLHWNARINLTAIREPEEIVTRHFGESFFLARHLFPDRPDRPLLAAHEAVPDPSAGFSLTTNHGPLATAVVDIGSGAGFPALPLKIWAPDLRLTLIESNHKKAAFLREAIRALTLMNVDVIAERAETVAPRQTPLPRAGLQVRLPGADLVTLRAVEKFDEILPLATSFLAPHGRLALLIGSPQLEKLQSLPSMNAMKWTSLAIPKSHSRVLSVLIQG
jgi:16S rRNA (guanine527-N7)-methyltransferase